MTTVPEQQPSKVEFLEFHRPPLPSGDYSISVEQTIANTGGDGLPGAVFPFTPEPAQLIEEESFGSGVVDFSVRGPRFALVPQEIHAVFPPAGSVGDHANVLPHISLTRSTLPWERSADHGSDDGPPWLAVLLFDEDELADGTVVIGPSDDVNDPDPPPTLRNLAEAAADGVVFPPVLLPDDADVSGVHLRLESAQLADGAMTDKPIMIVDVQRRALAGQLPDADELALLAHARRPILFTVVGVRSPMAASGTVADAVAAAFAEHQVPLGSTARVVEDEPGARWTIDDGDRRFVLWQRELVGGGTGIDVTDVDFPELAVVLGSRVPKAGGVSTAVLVSVEGRYDEEGRFDYQDAASTDLVRLVALKTWRFACVSPEHNFKALVENLNSSTPRLPANPDPATEEILASGAVPLGHHLRDGGRTVSWYRGPLAPGPSNHPAELPAMTADSLLQYHATYGMFDVSYASAWELGRLLTLENQRVSTALFQWKRSHRQVLRQLWRQDEPTIGHLHLAERAVSLPDMPDVVSTWFHELSLLEHVPFTYLVPDERLLPRESIRFFTVDPTWVACLLDGAFSVGRVLVGDREHEAEHLGSHLAAAARSASLSRPTMAGVVLRSEVVSGWPGLLVDGYRAAPADHEHELFDLPEASRCRPVRTVRLSPTVMLCLFEIGDGRLQTVDVHLRPETLHFGFDVEGDGEDATLAKTLRNSDGELLSGDGFRIEPVPMSADGRVLLIDELAVRIQQVLSPAGGGARFTAADFALQVTEGVSKVRFINR